MKSTPVAQYFEGRRKALLALGGAVAHPHRGVAGSERETLIRGFLKDHIPPMVGIGTGLVFGHRWANGTDDNEISTQQDIVIYRRDMPSLIR